MSKRTAKYVQDLGLEEYNSRRDYFLDYNSSRFHALRKQIARSIEEMIKEGEKALKVKALTLKDLEKEGFEEFHDPKEEINISEGLIKRVLDDLDLGMMDYTISFPVTLQGRNSLNYIIIHF
jgi:hypothetical protein